MTVKEAAGRLEISVSPCYRLVAEGRLPHLRIGGRGRRGKVVIREEHLREFLERCRSGRDPGGAPDCPTGART